MTGNQKEKISTLNKFEHKSPSNRWCRNGIHSLLSWAYASGSAYIIYTVCGAYRRS